MSVHGIAMLARSMLAMRTTIRFIVVIIPRSPARSRIANAPFRGILISWLLSSSARSSRFFPRRRLAIFPIALARRCQIHRRPRSRSKTLEFDSDNFIHMDASRETAALRSHTAAWSGALAITARLIDDDCYRRCPSSIETRWTRF
jgi:hypothetical protein